MSESAKLYTKNANSIRKEFAQIKTWCDDKPYDLQVNHHYPVSYNEVKSIVENEKLSDFEVKSQIEEYLSKNKQCHFIPSFELKCPEWLGQKKQPIPNPAGNRRQRRAKNK